MNKKIKKIKKLKKFEDKKIVFIYKGKITEGHII